ncbi:hypothetical protein J4558_23295 [Leptolyngbya sp. 15MV]|nr:hypothetical protein J4558_23295 [Leptolyngbya sp. 15MV]
MTIHRSPASPSGLNEAVRVDVPPMLLKPPSSSALSVPTEVLCSASPAPNRPLVP